jgi:hypothetical protein
MVWRKQTQRSLRFAALWFVLITAGGNIIISVHALLQLSGLRLVEPASALFRKKAA